MALASNPNSPEFYVYVFRADGCPFYVGTGRGKRASDRVRYINYLIRREEEGRPLSKGLSARVMMRLIREKVCIDYYYHVENVTRQEALLQEDQLIKRFNQDGILLINIQNNPNRPKSENLYFEHIMIEIERKRNKLKAVEAAG